MKTLLIAIGLGLICAACAHAPRGSSSSDAPLEVDSVTTALWHMDETGGTKVGDAGTFRLDAIAGIDTRTGFGRDHNGRAFTRSINSFLLVPYNPVFESGTALTVEAWIDPASYVPYEDSPIAARWTPLANEQSWILSLVGRRLISSRAPTLHQGLVASGGTGTLMFAYQPDAAQPSQAFFSSRPIPLNRWTHVAATFDGHVVRFYIDGVLDSQFASLGTIRHSDAPLLIGNFFDPRGLTDFGGDWRAGNTIDPNAYYAFEGMIDELRLSSAARTQYSVSGSH